MNITTVDFTEKNVLDKKVMNVYGRLQALIRDHYDGELNYHAFRNPLDREHRAIKSLLTNNGVMAFSERSLFPVFVDSEMKGYAEVFISQPSQITQDRIKALIDLLLSRSLKNSDRIRKIRAISGRLAQYDFDKGVPNNVVFLESAPAFKDHVEKLESRWGTSFSDDDFDFDSQAIFNSNLLVQGKDTNDTFKMVHEIHYLSKRYAFVNFAEISSNDLSSESLIGLGPVTLYVENVETLSGFQQLILKDLIKNTSGTNRPFVILGCQKSLEELQILDGIDQELLSLIGQSLIQMTQTYGEIKKQGLKDFIYSALNRLTV